MASLVLITLISTFGAGRAEAGVFSLFVSASDKSESQKMPSIQKMKILEVSLSPALEAEGGPDIITDESALIANDSPITSDVVLEESDQTVDDIPSPTIKMYVIKNGDTLSSIAGSFGVSVNTIVWANGLVRSETLKVGTKLTILPISGIQYTVKKGDTISGIAVRYGADIADIRDYNDVSDTSLKVGDKIIIPGAELKAEPKPQPKKVVIEPKVEPKIDSVPLQETQKTMDDTEARSDATVQSDVPEPIFGTLVRPRVNSGDSSDFGIPVDADIGRQSQGLHDKWAVDIAAPTGTAIHATQDGTVILVRSTGYNGGYGKYIAIEHENGIQTLYAHMSKTIVEVGDVVNKGQVIGLVGSTGHSTGPHVHYEVRGAPNNCARGCY